MKFDGNVAVITGGADGMGKALAMRLASQNCSVALCDIFAEKLDAAAAEIRAAASAGLIVSTHMCDVSNEQQCLEFARDVAANHKLGGRGLLLFNNAGAALAGSMITDGRQDWDKTFNICWGGVYLMTRAFMPLLLAAPEGFVINTSSVNGFWASIGFLRAHTAYAAAKFAVKGFSEALIEDFRLNAPHLKVACVMPGHIGTGIAENAMAIKGRLDFKAVRKTAATLKKRLDEMKASGDPLLEELNQDMLRGYASMSEMSDEQLTNMNQAARQVFRAAGKTTALQAADIILAGVRDNKWRILVGDDAIKLDKVVRENPVEVYEKPSLTQSVFSISGSVTQARSKL